MTPPIDTAPMLLLDIRQVATALGVSLATAERMKASGELPPPIRLQKRNVRWSRAMLEQWIAQRHADAITKTTR